MPSPTSRPPRRFSALRLSNAKSGLWAAFIGSGMAGSKWLPENQTGLAAGPQSRRKTALSARFRLPHPGFAVLGPSLRGLRRPKARDFLASAGNPAIYRAISHGNMARKAVRWQPGHKARLLTRFRRNQPEN